MDDAAAVQVIQRGCHLGQSLIHSQRVGWRMKAALDPQPPALHRADERAPDVGAKAKGETRGRQQHVPHMVQARYAPLRPSTRAHLLQYCVTIHRWDEPERVMPSSSMAAFMQRCSARGHWRKTRTLGSPSAREGGGGEGSAAARRCSPGPHLLLVRGVLERPDDVRVRTQIVPQRRLHERALG